MGNRSISPIVFPPLPPGAVTSHLYPGEYGFFRGDDGRYYESDSAGNKRVVMVPPLMAKFVRSTQSGNVVQTTVEPFSEIFESTDFNDDSAVVVANAAAATITINDTGRYRFVFGVQLEAGVSSSSARNNMSFWITRGGTDVGPRFQSNYVRDTNNHNEASQLGEIVVDVTSGDVFTVNRQRISGQGGVETVEPNSFLLVERVR